ncbi:M56 family metallopeptidase [Croceibacterium sp. TMG7-5b_MA50]|uniref:M56 family metallopeptidase n=1 Tax=Croceibacterium sp. TMG7-5b_MA50 TaxID=3121290 RepID=UPI003222000E
MNAAWMEWLADTVLWTGLLIALVLLVRRPVARACGPQVAYTLWALPFARLLLPPVVLPALPAPAPSSVMMLPSGTGEGLAPMMMAPAVVHAPAFPWLSLLAVVWAAGAVAFLLLRTVTYHRMRHLLLADAWEVGRVGRVRLVETPAARSPVAFGVIDQVVALPPHFMTQADRQARELALAHELSHHAAHDLLANMAAQLLLALHWCNPVAWLGWRAMRQDQEAACDARVMAGRSRADRACYAALIVGYSAPQSSRMMTLATPMAGPILGDGTLVQRLRSLARGEASPRRRLAGRMLLGVSALALPLTASISYAAQQDVTVVMPEVPTGPEPVPAADPASAAIPAPLYTVDPDTTLPEGTMQHDETEPTEPHDTAAWAAFSQRMEEWGRRMGARASDVAARESMIERDAEAMAAEMEQQLAPGGALHAMIERQTAAAAKVTQAMEDCIKAANVAGTSSFECRRPVPHAMAMVDTERAIEAHVNRSTIAALRGARASIAGNPHLSVEVRAEVLQELDGEIAALGHH